MITPHARRQRAAVSHAARFTPETETERVRLRQFTPADLPDLARIVADPEVMKYFGRAPKPLTEAEAESFLHAMSAHWSRHGFGRWAAEERATGKLIGCAGLRLFGDSPELVYLLDGACWGRGLATEVARECLRFGFAEEGYGFAEVVAFTRPENRASRRVLEKAGMADGGERDFSDVLAKAGIVCDSSEEWRGLTVVCYLLSRDRYLRAG